MSKPHNDVPAQNRWNKIVIALAIITAVLIVIAAIWWGNLAHNGVEKGPVSVPEALADSADDR